MVLRKGQLGALRLPSALNKKTAALLRIKYLPCYISENAALYFIANAIAAFSSMWAFFSFAESRHWRAMPEVGATIWSLCKLLGLIRSYVYAWGLSVRSITQAQVGRVQEIAGAQELCE